MSDTVQTGFTIERRFDATVDDLWQAWTDPGEMQQWFHPRGAHTPRESIEVDLRIGAKDPMT
ncbi:MAG: SRPBCC domain-containing protein [Acidimicrobiales bacterium]